MKLAAGVAIALLVIFGVFSYTKNVEARALLKYRSDSLEVARARVVTLQLERDAIDDARRDEVVRLTDQLDVARGQMDRLRRLNVDRRTALDTVLVEVPDTVRVMIVEAIEGLEAENRACRLALGNCETALAVRDSMIAGRDSTIGELRPLLTAYQGQLDDAIKAARPSPVRWIERGLAVYGLVEIARLVLR